MKLTSKLNTMLILLVICLCLVIVASYAWLTMATRPEVGNITANVGANGSLEIALLDSETYMNPDLIKSGIGDSSENGDTVAANKTWGNTIDLRYSYGLDQISLLPAQLNLSQNKEGGLSVGHSMLKVADYGIDGRVKILSDRTVSAVMEENSFSYKVDRQSHGVRAIGTASNITAQQIALATARVQVSASGKAAPRTLENTWRQYGSGIVDILYRHYALGVETFTQADATAVQNFLRGVQETVGYVDAATRYTVIGLAAGSIADEATFEQLYWAALPNSGEKLYEVASQMQLGDTVYKMAADMEDLAGTVDQAVLRSEELSDAPIWGNICHALEGVLDPAQLYLNGKKIAEPEAFGVMAVQNELVLPVSACGLTDIARFIGNYSVFSIWNNSVTMTLTSVAVVEQSGLVQQEALLQEQKAALGGWTQANMDNLYGFAIDLALRCNEPAELLLQIEEAALTDGEEENSRYGGGSYMRFTSENMTDGQLVELMDAMRVAFISDQNELLAVAKLSNYSFKDGGASGQLALYDFNLEIDGSLTLSQRRDSAVICQLPQNSPVIVTAVVWLDGDRVGNQLVSDIFEHSMTGEMNLQFSSSANLIPSKQTLKND